MIDDRSVGGQTEGAEPRGGMTIKGNREINRDQIEEIRAGNREEENNEVKKISQRAKEDKRQPRGVRSRSRREREKDERRSERASERRGTRLNPTGRRRN